MEAQNEKREIISVGDININTMNWNKDYKEKSNYDKVKHSMYKTIKSDILDNGNFQINSETTRENENGCPGPACLDVGFTTDPQNITSHQTVYPTFSDHALVIFNRNSHRMEGQRTYRKARSFKNFNHSQFSNDIINHFNYIPNLHEKDPELIATNLTTILQECLDYQTPVTVTLLSKKSAEKLSVESRTLLAQRDSAQQAYKKSKKPEDLLNFKILRNTANHFISKERYIRKFKNFNKNKMTDKEKWLAVKNETGQIKLKTPQMIKDRDKCYTKKFDISNSMNRQFLRKIRETQQRIPKSDINPLDLYQKSIGHKPAPFNLQKITMSQLRQTITSMSSTASTAADHISMRTIKQARKVLEPQFLNLVNQIIETSTFPSILKTTKVLPIPKPPKDTMTIDGWRPINIVPAISKIPEKVFMKQMVDHLQRNNLVNSNHHGSVHGHSTQSLVQELHDKLVQEYESVQDTALLLLDQSKAYDLVPHDILLGKMKILNYQQKTLNTLQSYLSDRKQYVQIEHLESDILPVGMKSVTQGSTLSCTFYLIFILDTPQIGHDKVHQPIQYRNCTQPSIATFVDDNYAMIKQTNKSLEQHIKDTIDNIQDYMNSNCLALNGEKTLIMIISKKKELKDNFKIEIQGKEIKHSTSVKILGNTLQDDLSWDKQVENFLIPNLKNRLRSLKLTTKYMTSHFKRIYTASIFRGKLLFGIETWGGVKADLISKVQHLQDQATDIALRGTPGIEKISKSQKNRILNWMNIQQEVIYATTTSLHKIIHTRVPATLAELLPLNTVTSRMRIHKKLSAKPRILNSTKLYRSTFRSRSYIYNTLPGRVTSISDHKTLKKMDQNPHDQSFKCSYRSK